MLTKQQIIHYEVASSWWVGFVSIGWMQKLASRYVVWKVSRKYRRYQHSARLERNPNKTKTCRIAQLQRLLRKYIRHVQYCQGTSFLDSTHNDNNSAGITAEEWGQLSEIADSE